MHHHCRDATSRPLATSRSARLAPGKYPFSIRAIVYKLDGAKSLEFRRVRPASADLKLSKVKSLVRTSHSPGRLGCYSLPAR